MALGCPEKQVGASALAEKSPFGIAVGCSRQAALHHSGVQGMMAPGFSPLHHCRNGSSGSPIRFRIISNHLRRPQIQKAYLCRSTIVTHSPTMNGELQIARAGETRQHNGRARALFNVTHRSAHRAFSENRST
jgi:hypothetical protein